MPTWNLGNLMSYATKRIGHRSDIALSDASFWANQAQLDFAYDVPDILQESIEYISVNSGTSQVSLPADWVETKNISLYTTGTYRGSAYTLNQVSQEYADAQGYYPVAEPQGYFVWNNKLVLWPSADSSANTTAWSGRSYRHRYIATPTEMTSTDSVPSIATEHRYGILLKLEVYLHQLVGNLEEASIAEARYVGYVSKLKDSMAKRQASRSKFAVSFPDRRTRTLGYNSDKEDYPWLRR